MRVSLLSVIAWISCPMEKVLSRAGRMEKLEPSLPSLADFCTLLAQVTEFREMVLHLRSVGFQ